MWILAFLFIIDNRTNTYFVTQSVNQVITQIEVVPNTRVVDISIDSQRLATTDVTNMIDGLPNLTYLSLESNNINCSLTLSVDHEHLYILSLRDNRLSSINVQATFAQLEHLDLSSNFLLSFTFDVERLPSLGYLNVKDNHLMQFVGELLPRYSYLIWNAFVYEDLHALVNGNTIRWYDKPEDRDCPYIKYANVSCVYETHQQQLLDYETLLEGYAECEALLNELYANESVLSKQLADLQALESILSNWNLGECNKIFEAVIAYEMGVLNEQLFNIQLQLIETLNSDVCLHSLPAYC
jgi:hypothetical protein